MISFFDRNKKNGEKNPHSLAVVDAPFQNQKKYFAGIILLTWSKNFV